MEHCIVYFSNWRGPFHETDLVSTLEQSRQNNAVDGITSVTLYVRGNIIQVLEGTQQAVEALFHRIKQDQRHTNVSQVLNRPIQKRLFSGSALAYETITASQLQEIKTIIEQDASQEITSDAKVNIVLKLIKVFYESNRYN